MKRSPLSGAYTGTAHATSEARTNGSGISPRVARKRKLFSWSCSALTDPGFALFAVGREGEDPRSCGYCDHVFTGAANHHDMLEHVSKAHKFGQCNAAKKVFRENTFRLHLECSHFVDDGKALESLMILCMIPTQPQPMRHNTLELDALEDTGGEHPPSVVPRASTLATRDGMWHVHPDDQSNETDHQGSAAQETRSMSSPASDMLVPAVVDPADLDDEYGMGALMMGSWDASLLGQWTSPSDRINRWLLHTLGSDRENMLLHKDMFLDMFSHTDFAADVLSRRGWSRCVLKYWFIDEAATGVNFEEAVKSLESLRGGSELPRSLRVDSKKQTRYEDEACGEIAAEHSPVFESEDVDEEALEASPEVVDDSDFPPTFPANDIPRPFTGNRRARED
ncbi:hypothetical protein GGR56DRAFT_562227 [Xylariaceae sp. FL0804]|nr:hypothetical protein GGR56DRAFT_562227 [Xylariaceae sp. FL0804]